ncbi:CHAD domain-containing protein [Streptomyces sp. NBC_01497]|uniref:CHAD domain-containing protein n=1 Tax=Streptomyces sp. NBC_01497 TaxID=2903885 RepID=UPI003FCCE3BA
MLSRYLHSRAGDFLRSLRLYSESGSDTATAEQAASALRASARRISGTLYTYRVLLDPVWADHLRKELAWLAGTLAQEHACTARLHRLVGALGRLSGLGAAAAPAGTAAAANGVPLARVAHAATTGTAPAAATATANGTTTATDGSGLAGGAAHGSPGPEAAPPLTPEPPPAGALTVGASRAGALLDRQLTLARTRAHSAALQALGSSRFHAVADAVAVLASEVPLGPVVGAAAASEVLAAPGEWTERQLLDAVAALPLSRASHPYNAEALVHGLSTASEGEAQDAPWHQVRQLLRLHRYAQEVWCPGGAGPAPVLTDAGRTLDRHRDAAEASAAAANAARTPRIAPATAYALGVLHADQRLEVEAARFAFQQLWQQATATAAR